LTIKIVTHCPFWWCCKCEWWGKRCFAQVLEASKKPQKANSCFSDETQGNVAIPFAHSNTPRTQACKLYGVHAKPNNSVGRRKGNYSVGLGLAFCFWETPHNLQRTDSTC
jgi:hypothetical protein